MNNFGKICFGSKPKMVRGVSGDGQDSSPEMNGWLIKRAVRSTQWKKRFFELRGSRLSFYKQIGSAPRGELTINGNTIVRNCAEKPYCFEIRTPTAVLFAYGQSARERDQWMSALQRVIKADSRPESNTDGRESRESRRTASRASSSSSRGSRYASSSVKNEDYIEPTHQFRISGTTFTLPSHYELIKPIGQGAYGVVISATDTRSGGKVAVKKVTKAFDDLVDAKRILREIKLLRHFDHENIIRILDIVRPPNVKGFEDVYIISELMETDLHRVIYSKQSLSEDHVQYFIYQILRGLKYMHTAKVYHRDLKPSNLLVNSTCDLKICDFGLSRGVDGIEGEPLTEYVVTRWYRAPEIMLSFREYSAAIDVWSVGCIMAELFLRKPLFAGNDYIHQLQLISNVIGTPSEDALRFITSSRARRFMRNQPFKSKKDYGRMFPTASADGIDLLDKMLQFDPQNRITIKEALMHPYMKDLHHPEDEPACPECFSFAFEQEKLSKRRLQELIYESARDFHPDRKSGLLSENTKALGKNDSLARFTQERSQKKSASGGILGASVASGKNVPGAKYRTSSGYSTSSRRRY